MIETSMLDNGITVVTERMPAVRSVALGFWVGVGSRDETDELAGASHFLEHLLFKGTATRSAPEIAEAIDRVGGDLNAFTTKEYTAFEVRLLADDVELGLDIVSDIMWSPAFRGDEVEAERQVILEEILMELDEPGDLVHDVFGEALYPGDPLGRSTLGTDASISAMRRDDIAAFHGRWYRPGAIVVAAAGDVDHGRIAAGVAERFRGEPGGDRPARSRPAAPPQPVALISRKTEQAHVVLGVRGLDRDDPDRYALDVVNHALGGGLSSRLFQDIRERRGLAYNVYSYRSGFEATGALALYAGTAPKNTRAVIDLFGEHLDRLAAAGVTERELDVAKGHVRGAIVLGLEDSGARMARLGRSMLVHGRVPAIDDVLARIEAVTVDDAARVIAAVAEGPRSLAVIGPVRERDVT
ncbi:MAG TPA: pitrilysin family protein [Acidimicrobiales bacterium]|nr:pitrilysin family protein [Acidimicrobiales bacterium]